MPKSKQTAESRYALRLPEDLYKQIQELAASENRSVNAQIITLLQEALEQRELDESFHHGAEPFNVDDLFTVTPPPP